MWGCGKSAGRRERLMLRWLFDVDSSAPVNSHRSLSWVMSTLLTGCLAELSSLFVPTRKAVVAELLRTG